MTFTFLGPDLVDEQVTRVLRELSEGASADEIEVA